MEVLTVLAAACGAFYAGYQRGRRVQSTADTAARAALVEIAEEMADQTLSGLGRRIRDKALKGLS